jgi:hypothetical protein
MKAIGKVANVASVRMPRTAEVYTLASVAIGDQHLTFGVVGSHRVAKGRHMRYCEQFTPIAMAIWRPIIE